MKKILILGAGTVGQSTALQLAKENDVTIVDSDPSRLLSLRERIDARTLTGSAEIPSVLAKAGANEADLVLAVAARDAVNLTASRICSLRFNPNGTQKRIARIRSTKLSNDLQLLADFGVSQAFSPEDIITESILGTIHHPGVSELASFASGHLELAVIHVSKDRAALGRTLAETREQNPELPFRVISIRREGTEFKPVGRTRLRDKDQVLLVADAKRMLAVIGAIHGSPIKKNGSNRKIAIAGGGNIGARLAERLERDYSVTLFEHDRTRCSILSQTLGRTMVLNIDATDESALHDEEIGAFDFFCAVTEHDEINIMSGLFARNLGASNIAVLVNRASYQSVLRANNIDVVISPSQLTIGSLLTHVRERPFEKIHQFTDSAAEALEFLVHDAANQIVGKPAFAIDWPAGVQYCALARPETQLATEQQQQATVIIDCNSVIASGDRLLLYVEQPEALPALEKLLSASPYL